MEFAAFEHSICGGLVAQGHPVEVIDGCVQNGQVAHLEAYLKDQKHAAGINESAWDIVPKVCAYLTDKHLKENPDVITACETVFKYLPEYANCKELLLSLLEQADEFKDNVKFRILLLPIQQCLLKLTSKRGPSIGIALETLVGHLDGLAIPEDHQLEGEERKLLLADEKVHSLMDAVIPMLDFMRPFIEEVSFSKTPDLTKDQLKQKIELVKFCIELCNRPLSYLDLTLITPKAEESENGDKMVISETRESAEQLVSMISSMYGNPVSLIEMIAIDNHRIEREKKKVASKDKGDNEDEDDGLMTEEAIPDVAIGVFAYLIFAEHLGQTNMPAVYTQKYILEVCLTYAITLLKRTYSLITLKGVKLLEALSQKLQPQSLSTTLLESDTFKELLNTLIGLMSRSQMKEICHTTGRVVPQLMKGFTTRGRYMYINYILKKSPGQWGVRGLAVNMLKNEIDVNLSAEKPNAYFIGVHLERLLNIVFHLSNGAETDLLECSDQIMPALNLLRYLVLRDPRKSNITGVWNYVSRIEQAYIESLRTGIKMSRAHYELELKHIKQGRSGKDIEMQFMVAGQPAPGLTPQQQAQAIEMAISTFDMMESVVIRVAELIEQQTSAQLPDAEGKGGQYLLSGPETISHIPTVRSLIAGPSVTTTGTVQLTATRRWCATSTAQQGEPQSHEKYSDWSEEDILKEKVLESALRFVPLHGWSVQALAAGAEAEGLPGIAHGLFPNGAADLISHFYVSCNARLADHMVAQKKALQEQDQKLRITPFIKDSVQTRLRMNTAYIDSWAQALAIMMLPQNAGIGWRNLSDLVDEIWHQAGDTSTDMNWYTKRLSLAAVYKASELHMLQDTSPDYEDTWQFLDRRIESVSTVANNLRQAQQGVWRLGELVEHGLLVGRNVIGANKRQR